MDGVGIFLSDVSSEIIGNNVIPFPAFSGNGYLSSYTILFFNTLNTGDCHIKKDKRKFNCKVTMNMSGVVKDGVSIEDLIKNDSEILVEPKNSNGCIVAINIVEIKEF